jgi:pseudo-rSAM protein
LNNKQWLILDNYVHVSWKGAKMLFYNPLNGAILEYAASQSLGRLVRHLQFAKNLRVVPLTGADLSNPEISRFVRELRHHFMADLIDSGMSTGKPIQMTPHTKVQRDVELIKRDPLRSAGESMMKYLGEVSLYINSTCSLGCGLCASAYKQFLCCTAPGKREMELPSIKSLFQQIKAAPLCRVNILGGDIFAFSRLAELWAILDDHPRSLEKIFYIHYLNLIQGEDKLAVFPTDAASFKIVVTLPVQGEPWQRMVELLEANRVRGQFLFIVGSEAEVAEAEALIAPFPPDRYAFHPYFDGINRAFFEANVFIDRTDIREAKPTAREIQARQLVNPFHFGTLTILSSGRIHANVNRPQLGTLGQDTIHEAVYKEMYRGSSWRRIRKKAKPCKHCTFEALCPPLSNYEYALARNDLCHIRK